MTNINNQWQCSEEYKIIREFSKLLIKAGNELGMSDIEITQLLSQKSDLAGYIKEAWLKRMDNSNIYFEYIHSNLWKARASAYKRARGYRCETVGCNCFNNVSVHHRNYKRLGRELDSDLICLCRNCHETIHNKKVVK
jgi:hypothetical protein